MVNFRKDRSLPVTNEVLRKRRQISNCLKAGGLLSADKGAWIAHRSREIVSGFVVDAAPLDTYISTFVLPAFDRHQFTNLSLGHRVIHCSSQVDSRAECKNAVGYYLESVGGIRSSDALIKYIDEYNIQGHYPIWVKYLFFLRKCEFDAARHYLDETKRGRLHRVQLDQLSSLDQVTIAKDKQGVEQVFADWSRYSERIFGSFEQPFDAPFIGLR